MARSGRVAYGKFFGKKAGFISKTWFPHFANWRRDGYDFDSRWDEELATMRQKRIMDQFLTKDECASPLNSSGRPDSAKAGRRTSRAR